jgi:hypothetical protein
MSIVIRYYPLGSHRFACTSLDLPIRSAQRGAKAKIAVAQFDLDRALPHWHKQAFEFQYITAGLTAYLGLTIAEEHVFKKGNFYVIEPGVVYAQKSTPSTEILFIGFRRIADVLRYQGSA